MKPIDFLDVIVKLAGLSYRMSFFFFARASFIDCPVDEMKAFKYITISECIFGEIRVEKVNFLKVNT